MYFRLINILDSEDLLDIIFMGIWYPKEVLTNIGNTKIPCSMEEVTGFVDGTPFR